VSRGTRQGGLTSPFIFNLVYQDLIEKLNSTPCGINIGDSSFNVFCYADDILLASTTVTGLQELIDTANAYVNSHGLRFNPTKTSCMTIGRNRLSHTPIWTIDQNSLSIVDGITYLGAALHDDKGESHVTRRTSGAMRAFHGLQGVGLHSKGVEPPTASHLYSVGIRPILLYACEAVPMKPSLMKKLDTCQGKICKTFLGLPHSSRNTPLFGALNIPSPSQSIGLSSLKLLRSIILFPSLATQLYRPLLLNHPPQTLVDRALSFARSMGVSFIKFTFIDDYFRSHSKYACPMDGISDSLKVLFTDFNASAKYLAKLLLCPFL